LKRLLALGKGSGEGDAEEARTLREGPRPAKGQAAR